MWPWGHVAVAYICYTAYTRTRLDAPPDHLPILVLAFGSVFPDLVDKPLAWYAGVLPTGRTLAHSLLFLVPLTVLVYLLTRRFARAEYGIAFAIGAISHALIDALPALWDPGADWTFLLWPLFPVEAYEEGAPTVTGLFLNSLSDPYFLSEFVLLGIAFVLWRRDGYPGLQLLKNTDDSL